MVDAAPIPPAPAGNAKLVQPKSQRGAKAPKEDEFNRELARRGSTVKDGEDGKDDIAVKRPAEDHGKPVKLKDSDSLAPVGHSPSLEDLLAQFLGTQGPAHQAGAAAQEKPAAEHADEAGHPTDRRTKSITGKAKELSSETLPSVAADEGTQAPPPQTLPVPGQNSSDMDGETQHKLAVARQPEEEHSAEVPKHLSTPDKSAGPNGPGQAPEVLVGTNQAQTLQTGSQQPAEQILEHLRAPAQLLAHETPAGKTALKAIQFDLRPEALGTVQVTLKLSGGKMEIEIAPRERETESLLRADAALVDQVVRAVTASGDVSSVTVNIAHRDPESGHSAGNWQAGQDKGSQLAGEGSGTGGGSSSPRKDQGSYTAHDQSEKSRDSTPPRASMLHPRVV